MLEIKRIYLWMNNNHYIIMLAMVYKLCGRLLLMVCLGLGLGMRAEAADIYPVFRVNDEYVTNYDIRQKIKLLQFNNGVVNPNGRVSQQVVDRVIDEYILEKLILQYLEKQGQVVPDEQVMQIVYALEKQNRLARGDLAKTLAYHQISMSYFLDQLKANSVWKQMVQSYVSSQVQMVSKQDLLELYAVTSQTSPLSYNVEYLEFPITDRELVEKVWQPTTELPWNRVLEKLQTKGVIAVLAGPQWLPESYFREPEHQAFDAVMELAEGSSSELLCNDEVCRVFYLHAKEPLLDEDTMQGLIHKFMSPNLEALQASYINLLRRNNYIEMLNEYK